MAGGIGGSRSGEGVKRNAEINVKGAGQGLILNFLPALKIMGLMSD